jgi:hypothetical protein
MAMYLILDNVVTHGIGEPGIVGHYVDCQIGFIDDFRIIDVRVLLNREDNNNNNNNNHYPYQDLITYGCLTSFDYLAVCLSYSAQHLYFFDRLCRSYSIHQFL